MQVLRLIIMRYVCPAAVAALSILAASLMWGQAGAPATLAQDLSTKLSDKFTDLTTDLEAFNTEPLV